MPNMTSFKEGAIRQRHQKQPSVLTEDSTSSSMPSSWYSQDPSYHSYPQQDAGTEQVHPALSNNETILGEMLGWILRYIKELLLGALMVLRPLLSLLIALLVLFALVRALTSGLNVARTELQTRVLCKLPGMGYVITCDNSQSLPIIPNFADLVDKQAKAYEYMLNSLNSRVSSTKSTPHGNPAQSVPPSSTEDSKGGSVSMRSPGMPLPMQLKKAEMAVVDLKVLVQHSGLPSKTRGLLVDKLERFHRKARVAGRKLQTLQARANGCIDSLVTRNTFLTRELDRLSDEQQSLAKRNADRSVLWSMLFGPLEDTAIQTSNRQLQTIYQHTMGEAQDLVRVMILQAQNVLMDLDELDMLLMSIHELSYQEQKGQHKAREEVLAILWTHLGFNQVEMKSFNENLELLQGLSTQREQATSRVQATLMKLNEFEDELGLLREKMVEVIFDPLLRDSTSGGGGRLQAKDEGVVGGDKQGEDPSSKGPARGEGAAHLEPLSQEAVARVLRNHVEQIDQVTTRLRERTLVSGSIDTYVDWIAE